MIIDFNEDQSKNFQADICIVGAGIASYAILSALHDTNISIIVLERGTMKEQEYDENSKSCISTGHSFTGDVQGRNFCIGGTSETWGGQALPFDSFDFEKREWISGSGWPISFEEISGYYAEADRLLYLDDISYNTPLHELQGLRKLEFDNLYVNSHFSKWSPRPALKQDILKLCKTKTNITLLFNACCTSIILPPDRREVNEVVIQSSKKEKGTIRAKTFILAAGGIENARLLLHSAPLNVGHTYVGRMFQDHPAAQVATIHPKNELDFQKHFNYFFKGSTRILPKLSLSSKMQLHNKVLAACGFIQFIPPGAGFFEASKTIYRSFTRFKVPSAKEAFHLISNLFEVRTIGKVVGAYLFHRRIYTPNSIPRLTIMLEQEPTMESFISLSKDPGTDDMPLAIINWQISNATISTLRKFCAVLETEFNRLELGKIEWDPWLSLDDQEILKHLTDAYHHMGSTRMSRTIQTGVVDENCKMHNVENLYIAGSSVFPTTSHSNPTLTIIALALRLAKHVKKDFINDISRVHV